jgi:hypothetical protein
MAADVEILCQGYDISRSAAILCAHVADGKLPMPCAVRDEPNHAVDTGWQFHCGVNHHGGSDGKVWAVKSVIKLDESIRQIIDSPPRSSFVRPVVAADWTNQAY